ncbi:unnamed protein product [Paramecium primaurelia]|uniref:Cyclic nucleotide-binding domain-containing protein n=1 Tax=Paramecium primaurelia TaxID=5886 RepID=A0A8S1PQE9_PARPR|nr:unnamed protein product [Paramecium primaurelia]
MSSDFFLEFEDNYNAEQHHGSNNIEESNSKQFRGPTRFNQKIDPLDEGDNTVKPPTVGSQYIDNVISQQSQQLELNKVPRVMQFSPPDSRIEENPLVSTQKPELQKDNKDLKDLIQTNTTQKEFMKNFLKAVIAKSYSNRFIENMLQKSYIKKPYHFSQFQNFLMDDLRYIYQHNKSSKHWLSTICKRLRFFPILDQSSYLVIGWQIIHILTIITVFFWTPFNISFGITYQQIVFGEISVKNVENYFLFTILIDVLIVLNTSYIEKGVIIKSRRKIFTNYLEGQAVYDLFSFCSLLIAIEFEIDTSSEKLGWQLCPYCIYYYCRLFKLQGRVHKLEEFFNLTGSYQDFIELIKLLFMVLYVGHLFACLWHGVAFYQQGYRQTWIDEYVKEPDMFSIYNYAFYWAVQTMITVGYGDLTPQNNAERICANISMFLACGVFAFSFNSIGLMLSNLNSRQVLYKKSINLLNQYLVKNQIKIELQSRIRNYYDYIFQEEQEINDEEVSQITTKLSSNLQEELNFEIRYNVMKTNKVLTKFSQKVLKQLSLQIEEVRFSPEDQILQQGICDDAALYIITKGIVCIQFQDDNQGSNTRALSYLTKGQSFGEYSFFTGMNRTASAKSVGFSRAYKIPRQQLLIVLAQIPLDLERYCEIRDSILLSNNYQPSKLSCYSCQKYTHLIKDCPVLHYVADQERIIKKEYFPIFQNRNPNYKRKHQHKKFETLKECKKTMVLIRDFQNKQVLDNVTVMDDELDVSYDDNEQDISPQEYSSLTKSLSKISRQQSQNRSYSQDNLLQPIQESDSSKDSFKSPNKQRVKQVKQTIQTAGFGVSESLHNRLVSIQEEQLSESIHDKLSQNVSQSNLQKLEEYKFSMKNDSLGLPYLAENARTSVKKITLVRKQKKEDSYKPFSSQTQVDIRGRGQSIQNQIRKPKLKDIREMSQEIPINPSVQSIDKRDQLRRKTTKTNRSKTARSLKTKVQDNHTLTQNQEFSSPIYDEQHISMELEGFEILKNFQYYFSWNNPKVIVARAMRTLKLNMEKRKNFGNIFSLYTFNNLAMNKALRIKRKLKLIDEPPIQINEIKKSHQSKSPRQTRIGNKRNTATQDVLGFQPKKPSFGTQIQVQGHTFNKINQNEFELK